MQVRLFYQNDSSEKKLLEAIIQSDEAAFEALFHLYKNRIFNFAFKFIKCATSAEEVVQESFLIIWQRRAQLKEVNNFEAYIVTIARNLVYKSLKQRAKQYLKETNELLLSPAVNLEAVLFEKELKMILNEAVERLPHQQQKVYKLVKEKGMKKNEVADLMNVAPDTVKFHLAKAMKSIRAYCAGYLSSLLTCTLLI